MSEPEHTSHSGSETPQGLKAALRAGFREFFQVIKGKGFSARRAMAVVSVLFLAGSLGLTGWALKRIVAQGPRHQEKLEDCKEMKCTLAVLEKHIEEKEAREAIRDSSVNLGEFEVSLVGLGSGERGQDGVLLEIDVSVQFDSAETGRWVLANLAPVRGLVVGSISMITELTKADLMTPEGKAIVRDRIRERVASTLPSGKVKDVYFNKFLLK
jgi:flagellar basal body-associated protein FliL